MDHSMKAHASSKLRVKKIIFGVNFLAILFLGLTMVADVYRVDLPSFSFENSKVHNKEPLNKYLSGNEVLLNDTTGNVTLNTHDGQRNKTGVMVTNISFLKVVKAGSTTMQNLFFRFGLRHNLNILLPRKGNYVSSKGVVIPLKPPNTYNIFACHTIYSLFHELIPTGSVKIGIVREPIDRIVSAAYYLRDIFHVQYLEKIPKTNYIHNLINHPEKYDKGYFSRTHNSMALDFGFAKTFRPSDTDMIHDYLDRLNSEFRLVMILEKFEESLIMMKRYLNWSFLDVIYLKTNSHKHRPLVLNKTEQAKVRKTNFLDFAIYEYFTKVFEEQLKAMKDDFSSEVEYFKVLLIKVSKFCSQANLQKSSKLLVDRSRWEDEFYVPAEECEWMKTGEIKFINSLRSKVTTS